MRLFFERDVPELRGKTRPERSALYKQASAQDWRIGLRTILLNFLAMLGAVFVGDFRVRQVLSLPWWLLFLIYMGCLVPIFHYTYKFLVDPLVRHALQNPKPNHALQPTAGADDVPAKYDY